MNAKWLGPAIVLMVTGCGDSITQAINERFPPLNVDQQRQAAIETSATALSGLPTPNIAFSVALEDVRRALSASMLKKSGITDLALHGEDKLVHVSASFERTFTEADASDNADARQVLSALRPTVAGTLDVYAGISGALSDDKKPVPVLEFRLLPGLSRVRVERITVAEKVDATKVGEAIAYVLNKYKDNVTGELSRANFTRITIPALALETINISQSIKVNEGGTAAKLDIQANPVTVPVKLHGVGWLIHDNRLTGIIQLSPIEAAATAPVAIERTFRSIRSQVEGHVENAFRVDGVERKSKTWVAVRKDLIAITLNSAVNQATACVTATGTSNQKSSAKIPMPKGDQIDCSPTRSCDSDRTCDVIPSHDTRDCNACLAYKPKLCAPFGGGCIGGGCLVRGNDSICELAKAAQNKVYEADAAGRKFDCERLRVMEKTTCEFEKAGEKLLCEAGKETLNALGRTGNFANLDVDATIKANGVVVCMREFTLSPGLDKLAFVLDAQGKVNADVGAKFVPLDIVGHLACQFPWTSRQDFEATLRESWFSAESDLKFILNDQPRLAFTTKEATLKTSISPSPTEYFLKDKNMTLACQGLNLLKPLALVLTPFIPQLQGDIDFKVAAKDGTLDIPLQTIEIGDNSTLKLVAMETPLALVLTGAVNAATQPAAAR